VGITIQNQVIQNDRPIGISFKWKDQLSADVIWSVFEKVSHSNSTFNALDTLVLTCIRSGCPSVLVKMYLRAEADHSP